MSRDVSDATGPLYGVAADGASCHSAAVPNRVPPRARLALLLLAALAADAVFLRAILLSGNRFGIWDWDYHCSLLEAARKTILEYGQWPLWNPWLGGGHSLAGHPHTRTASPSFIPVLVLGTLPGVKLDILLYMLVDQIGTAYLLRRLGSGWIGACLGALVASWGGCYAMHLTHGHVEWMAYSWVPWILASLEAAVRTRRLGALLAAGAFAGLTWMDGGPYQLGFVPIFVAMWAVVTAAAERSLRPLGLALGAGGLGVLLAAIKIFPVVAFGQAFPRATPPENHYFGAPFAIDTAATLWQMLLSRAQDHDPSAWMPFRINVGAYVGWLPLFLALLGLALCPRRGLRWLALLLGSLVIALSATLPVNVWTTLHELPGYSSMKIAARFNVFVLLTISVLAGLGADALARRGRGWMLGVVAGGVLTALDLLLVNAPVLDVAFSVPPVTLARDGRDFVHVTRSAYGDVYARTAMRPIWPNWPNATLPYVRANVGVVQSYPDMPYPRRVAPSDQPEYPGAEVFAFEGNVRVVASTWTPDVVTLVVEGDGGVVLVNRNAQRGWTLVNAPDGVTLDDAIGLLALHVPPGRHAITLAFHPPFFALGAGLSAFAWLSLLVFCVVRRRGGTAATGVLALFAFACGEGSTPPSDGSAIPRATVERVLLVSCDTLRRDHLSLYGYARPTSPRLDAFARDAVVFEQAWSCAPSTAPALSALMTSRLPDEVGMAGGNRTQMPAKVETLAEILRSRGVRTGAVVSNWTLRRSRPEDGDVGLAQGFDVYDDRMDSALATRPGVYERVAPATTDAALALVDGLPRDQPAFVWVHYQDPHGPYTPPAPDLALFERADPGETRLPVGTTQSGLGQIPAYQALNGETRVGAYLDRYDAEIHLFDRELGRLLDGLGARGWLDGAMVLFTADHGESLGERDLWFCHETNLHADEVAVPLLVRPPGGMPGGPRRSRDLVSHLDLLPTVLDAFGFAVPPSRGASLLGARPADDRLVAHTLGDVATPEGSLGLTRGRWRLLVNGEDRRLFDSAADPAEGVDVSSAHPDVVRDLLETYARLRANPPSPPIARGVDRLMDERTRAALRALGYLEDNDQ
jgi:arylsulfatase